MFNLVETEPRFNTFELLESMVKVSEIQKERFDPRICGINEAHIPCFSLGRQCGHTTAIHEYALIHSDEKILVVCPNQEMIRYCKKLYKHDQTHYCSIGDRSPIPGVDVYKVQYDRVFFDAVKMDQVRDFIKQFPDIETAKSIVCIGVF